jgi:hypothetical protein
MSREIDRQTRSALLGLFLFSAFMFTLPIGAFFAAKHLADTYFELETPMNLYAAAIFAVFVVNVIIVAYIVKAFREDSAAERPKAD